MGTGGKEMDATPPLVCVCVQGIFPYKYVPVKTQQFAYIGSINKIKEQLELDKFVWKSQLSMSG